MMMTEAEVWKTRYQALKSAVVGVCGTAETFGMKMGGKECLDLITQAIKAIEDEGSLDVEREPEAAQGEGEEPADVAGGV